MCLELAPVAYSYECGHNTFARIYPSSKDSKSRVALSVSMLQSTPPAATCHVTLLSSDAVYKGNFVSIEVFKITKELLAK
jgi:hypothetical protein